MHHPSGVCTINNASNGSRQDWLVCPYRALDPNLIDNVVRRLFGAAPESTDDRHAGTRRCRSSHTGENRSVRRPTALWPSSTCRTSSAVRSR